jgi:hypothetical protein
VEGAWCVAPVGDDTTGVRVSGLRSATGVADWVVSPGLDEDELLSGAGAGSVVGAELLATEALVPGSALVLEATALVLGCPLVLGTATAALG